MTDTQENPGGWPAAPGVPLNPERDGWHWVSDGGTAQPEYWYANPPFWRGIGRKPSVYLGPCHLPTTVAALVEAARAEVSREAQADMQERCAYVAREAGVDPDVIRAMRALPVIHRNPTTTQRAGGHDV